MGSEIKSSISVTVSTLFEMNVFTIFIKTFAVREKLSNLLKNVATG